MNMLQYFFEYGCDGRLFEGLEINREKDCCEKDMGKFPMIFKMKYADDADLEKGCTEALAQIERRGYVARLRQDGRRTILKYGITCYKKRCRVAGGLD